MPSAEANRRIEEAMQRVRSPEAIRVSNAIFPVTHLQDYFLCPRRYLYAHRVGLSEHPLSLEIDDTQEAPPLGGRSADDRRQQGIIAHRLLQLADLSLVNQPLLIRAQIQQLLWEQGIDPFGAPSREIARWVERFLCTRFASRISAAGEGRVHRELPFLLRLSSPEGHLQIHLKGQIDLLFEDEDGGAMVIDYKASPPHPAGLTPYAFQLDCYALAARHFVKEGVSVRTGIAFLQQAHPEPEIRRASARRDLRDFERRLVDAAAELLRSPRAREWPGLPAEKCAAIRCGYQYRCHAAIAEV
jgi:ATP-dependent exoDNAse (exonuclease V) beta subunit